MGISSGQAVPVIMVFLGEKHGKVFLWNFLDPPKELRRTETFPV